MATRAMGGGRSWTFLAQTHLPHMDLDFHLI